MSAEIIVSTASMLISLCTFVALIFELRQARHHNRASLRPTLQITSHGSPITGLQIKNVGLGPAIIFDTKLFIDGQIIGKYNQLNVEKLANDIEPAIGAHISKMTFGNDDYVMEPNSSGFIFGLKKFEQDHKKRFDKFIEQRFSIIIEYRSLYGEKQKVSYGDHHLK